MRREKQRRGERRREEETEKSVVVLGLQGRAVVADDANGGRTRLITSVKNTSSLLQREAKAVI